VTCEHDCKVIYGKCCKEESKVSVTSKPDVLWNVYKLPVFVANTVVKFRSFHFTSVHKS